MFPKRHIEGGKDAGAVRRVPGRGIGKERHKKRMHVPEEADRRRTFRAHGRECKIGRTRYRSPCSNPVFLEIYRTQIEGGKIRVNEE